MFPRCAWSISNALGSVTLIDLMFASPGRVLRSSRRGGFFERPVFLWPPSWRTVNDGLKGSAWQLTAWKKELNVATVPWSPIPCESIENGLQLVGLIVKF